jgi:L-seryl-tRNA(Ser) seleniumtransferase
MSSNPLRNLPSVTEVLQTAPLTDLAASCAHDRIVTAVRSELTGLRQRLTSGEALDALTDPSAVATAVAARLASEYKPLLRPVINATGIVLHTNLGRAPVAEAAAQAAYEAARGYLNLELDLAEGKRASRQSPIRAWVCRLTGAESATAVNNNAAATVIALRALCAGREAIIARGQLIEIGGSFRIPEIMAVSGAILREVGTTNINRPSDYERAIGPATGALMRIHTSNYRISGFTESTSLADLVALASRHALPVIDDIGSGALIDFQTLGFRDEPIASESIAAGADLVLFSADKLLGGPQAGIIAGRKDLVEKIEKDPLMRAFRLDKMTLASLEATLRIYLDGHRATSEIPTLRMLSTPLPELRRRAESLASRLSQVEGVARAIAREDQTFAGGGSLPDQAMRTCVVEVSARALAAGDLAYRLRTGEPAVVGRVHDASLLLDVRTVLPDQETDLIEAVQKALDESLHHLEKS